MTGERASEPSEEAVDRVLDALADATRRRVLEVVASEGPLTATVLARRFPVSRQAVSKHLERLAVAGLVESRRSGRETIWSARPAPLGDARAWLTEVESAWDRRLGALASRARRGPRT